LPNVELSYTYTNYNRGGKGKHLCASIFQKYFLKCPIFPQKMGLSNKSGFYKQTNKQKTPKNKIKKGCTPKQINGNYKDRHLCSIITIGKKAPLLYCLD
jgi:hypothetical protein